MTERNETTHPHNPTEEDAMMTPRRKPSQPLERALSPTGKRSLLLRSMVATSLLIGTFAFARSAEATVSVPSCGSGAGNMCSSWEVCLLGFCLSGKRYYDHENPEPEPVETTYFCTSKTCQ